MSEPPRERNESEHGDDNRACNAANPESGGGAFAIKQRRRNSRGQGQGANDYAAMRGGHALHSKAGKGGKAPHQHQRCQKQTHKLRAVRNSPSRCREHNQRCDPGKSRPARS